MTSFNSLVKTTKLKFCQDHFNINITEKDKARNGYERDIGSIKEYGGLNCQDVQVQFHGSPRAGLTLQITFEKTRVVLIDLWASRCDLCNFTYGRDNANIHEITFRHLTKFSKLPVRIRYPGVDRAPATLDPLDPTYWGTGLVRRLSGDIEVELELFTADTSVIHILEDVRCASEQAYESHRSSATVFEEVTRGKVTVMEIQISPTSFCKDQAAVCLFTDGMDYKERQSSAFRPELVAHQKQNQKVIDASTGQWNAKVSDLSDSTIQLDLSRLDASVNSPDLEIGWTFELVFQDFKYGTGHGRWLGSITSRNHNKGSWKMMAKMLEPGKGIGSMTPRPNDNMLLKLKSNTSMKLMFAQLNAIEKFAELEDQQNELPWGSMKRGISGPVHKIISFPNRHKLEYAQKSFFEVAEKSVRESFNDQQKHSFDIAFGPKMGISLTVGPPGTGKTKLIVGIASCLALRGYHVIICGPSNSQLDDIASKCEEMRTRFHDLAHVAEYRVTRLYSPSREFFEIVRTESQMTDEKIEEELELVTFVQKLIRLPDLSLSKQVIERIKTGNTAIKTLFEGWQKESNLSVESLSKLDEAWIKCQKEVLSESRIVICTCQSSIHPVLRDSKEGFDYMIMDEASQLVENLSLLPLLAYGAAEGKKRRRIRGLKIVGDDKQLGAILKCLKKDNPQYAQLDTTLFTRLLQLGFQTTKLVVQYRMRDEILAFPNTSFYGGELQTGYTSSENSTKWDEFSSKMNWPLGLVQLNTKFTTACQNDTRSWYNTEHVQITLHIIERGAKESDLPFSEFAIVAAYKAQKSEYEKNLSVKAKVNKEWNKVIVGTIDEMEGRETGVEILDLTITAQAKENKSQLGMGFLKDDRRINVAVTRARYGLIILTDREFIKRVDQGAKGMKALGVYLKGSGRPWEGFGRLDVPKSVGTKRKRGLDV